MKVKIMDRANKADLEKEISELLKDVKKVIGLNFNVRRVNDVTWWSALIIYE